MHRQFPKLFTAIEVVLYIACTGGQLPVCSKEICEYQGVTLRYLEHILQQLVRGQVLKGFRGPKGGYLLAKDRRRILISDIYDAIIAGGDEEEATTQLHQKIMLPMIGETEKHIREHFRTVTIQDLYEKAKKEKVDVVMNQPSDFVI